MKTEEFLRQVTALPGVTGNERKAAEFIAEALLTWTMAGKDFDEIFSIIQRII